MRRLFLLLLYLLPLAVAAQTVPVPPELNFAGLRLRLTDGGRQAIQLKVDALRRYPTSFHARVVLADAYFPLIERVFQAEGVPLDFRFLVVQESGLQGDAQSIHDAVGYWQFKRESAADFGLVMTDQIDERKHIIASSRAAAQYLKRYNDAGLRNWLNALLAYNLGPTGVKPYTRPADVDATEMEISEKTHPYVLTLLAHKVAYEPAVGQTAQPALQLQEFPAPPGFTLLSIARTMQSDPAELTRHNRWLLAAEVPSDRRYTVLVPITDALQQTALAAQQRNATAGQLLHKPQADPQNAEYVRVNGLRALVALPGETKEDLARRAGLKLRKFMQYNDLFPFDNIVAGQPYFVMKKRDKAEVEYHVTQTGESVATVSQKYGIRAKAIWSKNRMPRNEELRPGRILWLQHTRPKDVAIEYADSKNEAALAAFERPASKPVAAKPIAKPAATRAVPMAAPEPEPANEPATEPAPAKPTAAKAPAVKKRRIDESEPYRGKTASSSRALEDEPEDEPTPAELATTPDSAATDNATELASTPPAPPAATPTKPAPAPSAAPARGVYAGRPTKKNLPTAAPVADEPRSIDEVSPSAAAPAAPASTKATAAMPVAVSTVTAKPAAPKPLPPALPAGTVEPVPATGMHTVQPKESLYAVARRYGLRPADLIAWNNLPQNPSLRVGQTLRVADPTATASVAATPVPAKPAAGASASTSAAVASVTKATAGATASAAPPPAGELAVAGTPLPTVRHTVAARESMYAISRKYGVTIKQIMEWNNKSDFNVKPGEVLTVKPMK